MRDFLHEGPTGPATVFRDPRALSLFDTEHGAEEGEDRWITMGLSADAGLLVVHHTFQAIGPSQVRIRIFSARKAVRAEIRQYGV